MTGDDTQGEPLAPRRTEAATQASAKKPRTPAQQAAFAKAQAARKAAVVRRSTIRDGGELPKVAQPSSPPIAAPRVVNKSPEVPIVPWESPSEAAPKPDASIEPETHGSTDASTHGTDATVPFTPPKEPVHGTEKPEAHIEPLPEETPAPAKKPLIDRLIDGFKEGAGL